GHGSAFTIRLPLAWHVVGPGIPSPAAARAAPGGRKRVLVIEDIPDTRESLRQVLSLAGHEVEAIGDGHEGLKRALQWRPDVALIDIGLPGIDGFEIASTLREAIPRNEMLLIAVTGYGAPSDRERSARAGFDAHLLKPVDFIQLEK